MPASQLLIGVATSVCQTNVELVSDLAASVDHDGRALRLVPTAWSARNPTLSSHSGPTGLAVRRFIVRMRARLPIAIVDAYWDDRGEALCPMATGVSHHIGPGGHIRPCPVIQFATDNVRDSPSIYETTQSAFLRDFREAAASATRGACSNDRTSCAIWCESTGRTTPRSAAPQWRSSKP
jgi:hypothetical protein